MDGIRSLGICRTVKDLKAALANVPDAIALDIDNCTEVEVTFSSNAGITTLKLEPFDTDVDVFESAQIDYASIK